MRDDPQSDPKNPTRREFLRNTGGTAAAAVIAGTTPVASGTAEQISTATAGAEGPRLEGAVPTRCGSTAKTGSFEWTRGRHCSIACGDALAHRNEEGLRSRSMRRLHGARKWPARAFMLKPSAHA